MGVSLVIMLGLKALLEELEVALLVVQALDEGWVGQTVVILSFLGLALDLTPHAVHGSIVGVIVKRDVVEFGSTFCLPKSFKVVINFTVRTCIKRVH